MQGHILHSLRLVVQVDFQHFLLFLQNLPSTAIVSLIELVHSSGLLDKPDPSQTWEKPFR